MSEHFKTPCPLPTAYEREILTILIEEAAEVQQRATKLLRFGRDEIQPGQLHSNKRRLSYEIGDLLAMIDMANEAGVISKYDAENRIAPKREKVAVFLQSEAALTSPGGKQQ